MSTACDASVFLFELFKKNLESICCPSYEMNAGSWVSNYRMQGHFRSDIIQWLGGSTASQSSCVFKERVRYIIRWLVSRFQGYKNE